MQNVLRFYSSNNWHYSPTLWKLVTIIFLLSSCGTTAPIQKYNESSSHFKSPTQLMSNSYPQNDFYRIYQKAGTGFSSIEKIREHSEQRVREFAQSQGKSFVILGSQNSNPPYILGNYQRVEIVFALFDKTEKISNTAPKRDKFSELEKLKKYLDNGTLTKEEYEKEKKKILDEKE